MVEKFLTLEDVAKLFGVSERTILREVQAGKLRSFRVGRMLRFEPDAIQEYINHQEVFPDSDDIEEDGKLKDAA